MSNCVLCDKESDERLVKVTTKGVISLKSAALARGEIERHSIIQLDDYVKVHENCRKNYVNKKNIENLKRKIEQDLELRKRPRKKISVEF